MGGAERDEASVEQLLKAFDALTRSVRGSSVLHEPRLLQLVIGEHIGQIRVEFPDDLAVALAIDGDGPAIFFEPVGAEEAMSGVVGHEGSDLRALQLLLRYFFRW